MLSGWRALEFLGGQGVTALGNFMLSHRDSLLLDVQSTVPAVEVARLCYADLFSSFGLFPSPLLDSALTKMRAALIDILVQWTLHPPKIPWKSAAGPVKQDPHPLPLLTVAAPLLWCLGHRHKRQLPPPLLLPSRVERSGDARVRHPFCRPPAAPVASERVPGKSPPDGVPLCCG